jgi:hypothetical protein
MGATSLLSIELLEPWEAVDATTAAALGEQLRREVTRGHPLHGRDTVAVARRIDNDNVLFTLPDGPERFAVVHLTYAGASWLHREYPSTAFYSTLGEWVDGCMMRDHHEYNSL